LISAATKSTNDRKNISNKPNYQKKRKKKKLWYDNECEVKYRHVKNLANKFEMKGLSKSSHNLSKSKFNKFDLKVISLVSFHLIFLTLFFKQSCEYLSEN
jgi:hypothetical protein